MTEQPAPGAQIPTPPDFPVRWENPGDERMLWTPDLMHFPAPIAPMDGVLARHTYQDGFNAAADAYELPIRLRVCRINTYFYMTVIPVGAPPEAVAKLMTRIGRVMPGLIDSIQNRAVEAQVKRYGEKMEPVMARLGEYWDEELLPEIKKHLAYWEGFDLRGATSRDLFAHLAETIARIERLYDIHFRVICPCTLAMSSFDDLYRDLFGGEDALEAYKLLQGFDNKALEADRELWRLSRKALRSPAVLRVLEEIAAADVVGELEKSVEGRAFLGGLRDYLQDYGYRGDRFQEVSDPRWIEDPSPAIKNLKDYVTQPDRDPEAELAAMAEERERLATRAREQLTGYPRPVRDRFEFLLEAAQSATVLQEDHSFWIDQRATHHVRQVLLEFGSRCAQTGTLEDPEDVFYLTPDELREMAGIDRRRLVSERRAEVEHFRGIRPAPAIGSMPLMEAPDEPLTRAFDKFFGSPPKSQAGPDTLFGNAGSPGTARGPAKVVRSLAEADELRQGDILVAETTAPPWTPLFATAAAIVTDTGGVLSHCAVVAREYRIPAVVGTGTGTVTIHDGQLLEVDGDAGVVRIVEPS